MQAELPPTRSRYAELARDIFLFSYFSAGIDFMDTATLRHVDMDEGRIYHRRHKTDKPMTCRMHPLGQQIHNRMHKVLVHINRKLKAWSKLPGLTTPLTTYLARHTFAALTRTVLTICKLNEMLQTNRTYLSKYIKATGLGRPRIFA